MDTENPSTSALPTANCQPPTRSGWTFILISIGISLIASCLLIPQADEIRDLRYQCAKLKLDLEHINKQVQVNEEFVQRVSQDPSLAERLAQRQMKFIRQGATVLELPNDPTQDDLSSPFLLATVPPPGPLAELQPVGGRFADLCRNTKSRLYMIGAGLMLLATGLVLGHSPKTID